MKITARIALALSAVFAVSDLQAKYHDDESDLIYYGYRYNNPTHGRWLSRDPIEENGGHNLYAFVGNRPVGSIDPLGLSEGCEKCGVKSLRLTIVGLQYGYDSYGFHLVGEATFKTRADGRNFRGYCCVIRRWIKSRVVWNGKPAPTADSGVPLDGKWHIDQPYWGGPEYDRPERATTGVGQHTTVFTNEEGDVTGKVIYDQPGISSGLREGVSFSDDASFRLTVYDSCQDWKAVKTSRTVSYHIDGTWPSFRYSYTR